AHTSSASAGAAIRSAYVVMPTSLRDPHDRRYAPTPHYPDQLLQRAVERRPAGQHLVADRRDQRDGADDNEAGDQRVFHHFAALLIREQLLQEVHHFSSTCFPSDFPALNRRPGTGREC